MRSDPTLFSLLSRNIRHAVLSLRGCTCGTSLSTVFRRAGRCLLYHTVADKLSVSNPARFAVVPLGSWHHKCLPRRAPRERGGGLGLVSGRLPRRIPLRLCARKVPSTTETDFLPGSRAKSRWAHSGSQRLYHNSMRDTSVSMTRPSAVAKTKLSPSQSSQVTLPHSAAEMTGPDSPRVR